MASNRSDSDSLDVLAVKVGVDSVLEVDTTADTKGPTVTPNCLLYCGWVVAGPCFKDQRHRLRRLYSDNVVVAKHVSLLPLLSVVAFEPRVDAVVPIRAAFCGAVTTKCPGVGPRPGAFPKERPLVRALEDMGHQALEEQRHVGTAVVDVEGLEMRVVLLHVCLLDVDLGETVTVQAHLLHLSCMLDHPSDVGGGVQLGDELPSLTHTEGRVELEHPFRPKELVRVRPGCQVDGVAPSCLSSRHDGVPNLRVGIVFVEQEGQHLHFAMKGVVDSCDRSILRLLFSWSDNLGSRALSSSSSSSCASESFVLHCLHFFQCQICHEFVGVVVVTHVLKDWRRVQWVRGQGAGG